MKKGITKNSSFISKTKLFIAESFGKRTGKLSVILILMTLYSYQSKAQWTNITALAPHNNYGPMILLSNGTVFCKSDGGNTSAGQNSGNIWDILTPDIHGSYVNGTWTSSAPMITERYSFSSQMMMDGRLYVGGGEYGTDGTQNGYHAETYNPITNSWTACLGTSTANVISDGNVQILPNGNLLQAIINVSYPKTTRIYSLATNNYVTGPNTIGGQNESMWLKLPDSTILFVDEGALTSERYFPSTNTWVADANVPVAMYDPWGLEAGPALLLPDGRGFFIASQGYTAYYTPSGNSSAGTWTTGPSLPNNNGMPDAPAAMEVNGKIIIACCPVPTSANEFNTPTYFYEFDYLTNTYTQLNSPTGGLSFNGLSQQVNFIDLPNGQVMCCINSDPTSAQYYVYTPTGTPVASGKPLISSVVATSCTEYVATGQKFNGISEGSAFGDENQNSTNYPIVKLTQGTDVYYCRTHNWSCSGVMTGTETITTGFTLPSGLPAGTYNLYVIANGISSDSILFTTSLPSLSSSIAPPAICTGTAFTYVPASATPGATFTWTRAAVAGISNAAITTAQTINPNEVLVNTTAAPVTVVYSYIITGGGCTNQENVSVVVNPPAVVSFTANPTSFCVIPASVHFTNTTIAGGTYVWSFGDGDTSSVVNATHIYAAGGNYTVKLVTTNSCGKDSLVSTNFITVNPLSSPVATSPVNINCGNTATLTATGDSLHWYNQPTGGTSLGTGNTYTTPVLNGNTTYYVQKIESSTPDYSTPVDNTMGAGAEFTATNNHYEVFNVTAPCTLLSVLVYATGAANRVITLSNQAGTQLNSATVYVPNGTSRVTLNFPLSVGTGYQLGCAGTTDLYRNSAGAAYPYSDPNGLISITGNDIPDAIHYYYFYDWELQGPSCSSAAIPVVVNVSSGVTPSYTYSQSANTFTFTNTSTGSTSWLWNFGDGDTSTVQSPVHTYLANGNYTVTLYAYNGVCYDTVNQIVSIITTGMSSLAANSSFKIYPNPTDGIFNLEINLSIAQDIKFRVMNILGETISARILSNVSSGTYSIDLSNEAKGIYFVEINADGKTVVKKVSVIK